MVGPGRADGLRRARVLYHARVDTFLVDAGLGLGTVGIRRALGSRSNWIAVGEGVSSHAGWAGTG